MTIGQKITSGADVQNVVNVHAKSVISLNEASEKTTKVDAVL